MYTAKRRVERPPQASLLLILPGLVPMLVRCKLTFRHGIIPGFAVDSDQIENSVQWWNELPTDVVFRVQLEIPVMLHSARVDYLHSLAYPTNRLFSNSSGAIARSTSLEPSPFVMTYGTRSPYSASARGSSVSFRLATMTPGGGGPRSLHKVGLVHLSRNNIASYTYE